MYLNSGSKSARQGASCFRWRLKTRWSWAGLDSQSAQHRLQFRSRKVCRHDHPGALLHVRQGHRAQVGHLPGFAAGRVHGRVSNPACCLVSASPSVLAQDSSCRIHVWASLRLRSCNPQRRIGRPGPQPLLLQAHAHDARRCVSFSSCFFHHNNVGVSCTKTFLEQPHLLNLHRIMVPSNAPRIVRFSMLLNGAFCAVADLIEKLLNYNTLERQAPEQEQ